MIENSKKTKGKINGVKLIFVAGFLAVLCQMVPYLLLGEGTVIPYHDQLDGEFIAYMLQAKWLFKGEIIPEFMGGAFKTALTAPAPGFVPLFCVLSPFAAYALMHLLEIVVAYIGMYLLAKEVKCNAFFAMIIAVVFAYLPFLPVYGLSQFGIPMLVWLYLRVRNQRNYTGALVYSVVYALFSSLVLVGFGVLFMLLAEAVRIWIWDWFVSKKKSEGKNIVTLFVCLISMGTVYAVENYRLIFQMLGIGKVGDVVSHKAEYAPNTGSFILSLKQMLLEGGSHSADYHIYLVYGSVFVILICVIAGRKIIEKKEWKLLGGIYGWIVAFVLIAAFWLSGISQILKDNIGFLSGLAVWRVMWIVPTLWYMSAAVLFGFLGKIWNQKAGKKRIITGVATAVYVAVFGVMGALCIWKGTYPANVCRFIGREYSSISFEEYYAVGVMEQVKDYIYKTTGERPEDYKVMSLGIDPGAAYYHGFYCLDGYSNNYSLDYKHKFREVIEPELEKSDYLRASFDDWGNRCYLWCAQIAGYYNHEKHTSYFWNYAIDTKAAKDLGAKYILSAVYLTDPEATGLKRVREEAFETQDSYYAIYLYEIE